MTEAEGWMSDDLGYLRQMADTIDAVFWLALANEPQILYVSPAYDRIWGRDRQRLYTHGHEFFESIHSDDRERVQSATSRCVAQEMFEVEYRVVRPDGEVRWVRDRGFLMRDQAGAPYRLVGFALDITEYKQSELALHESEAWYRRFFDSMDEGFCVIEMLFDENETPIDYRFLEINSTFAAQTGLENALGKRMRELKPDLEQHWFEIYGNVALTGEPIRFENSAETMDQRWFDVYAYRYGQPQNRQVAILFKDITDRKRREAHFAFLTEMQDDFARLTSPDEIMQTVGEKIGLYLNFSVCAFADVDEVRDEAVISYNWHREDVPSVVGIYRISEFVTEEFHAAARAGEIVIVRDTNTDARTDTEKYAALNINSFISVPFLRDRQWKFLLNLYDSRPRDWRSDEIELFRELSNRIFSRLERARAEVSLRESEAKYRTLFESINEGFCICEMLFDDNGEPHDYRFLEVNPMFEALTGLERATGKTARELIPNQEGFCFETYGRVVLTGEPARFENQSMAMNRWFDVNAFRVGESQSKQFAILLTDISDRKQAEEEREQLLAREQQYTTKLHELNQAALALNSTLSIEAVLNIVTEQAYRIIGTHQSVIHIVFDHKWSEAITVAHLSNKYAQWRDYDTQTDGTGIYVMICQMNQPIRMTQAELEAHPRWRGFGTEAKNHPPMRGWLAAPLIGRDGHNIGLIQLSDKYEGEFTEEDEAILVQLAQIASVAVESARFYQIEQQVRKEAEAAREEAERANRIKDEFLAVLSHELRSPLNPILGWSKLLQSGKLDAAITQQALKTIERNAHLQSELIEDLLDVSRILCGKLNLNVRSVNLTMIIRAALETVRLAAEAKSIQVEASLAEVAQVSGDSTRLQQVVWNLLSNAVKFTPAGGRVEVRLTTNERTDAIDQLSASSVAQITVRDNGKGIAPEFLPHMFDYFQQENSATTRKFGGLGLGLALVRQIVELHGGTVQVESQGKGLGTTFTVRLPLMPIQSSDNSSPDSPFCSLDLNGVQVLVVDDEADSRDFIAFVVEQAGAMVKTAATAIEAMAMLVQSQVDVLLSDIGMPDMDGYMLMQQVRALPPEQNGQLVAIALTAYAGDFNQQQAIQAGFQQHLSKPVEPEVLVKAIAMLLRSNP